MDQPRGSPSPVTAESTASLLTSLSAGASHSAAHSCQVEDPALGSAVELIRGSACLSLRTAAATQRRLFTDSANLDNDDGVALNRVSKGSLERRRVSKSSLEDRRVSKGSLEYGCVSRGSLDVRQVSKGSRDMVSPAVGQRQVPTAALLAWTALAGHQSMQRPLSAVPHSTMAPIAAVLIVMLLAIVAVCATHCIMVRGGSPAPVQLSRQ